MNQSNSTPSFRPSCWGKSFEEGNRECRNCGVQGSCKDELIRMNVNRPAYSFYQPYQAPAVPAPPVPTYYQQQPAYQQPYQPPPQYQQVPVRTFQFQPPQQMQAPVVQQQRPPQQMMTPVPYGYGWVNDPLQYSLYATPPLTRPQMQGETFVERVVKNTGLAMFESFLVSMLLAVRQMVWEPEQKIIDVTPQQQAPQMPIPQPPPKGT